MLDLTMQAIQTSLDGLAARQRIIAQNLANSETPGYTRAERQLRGQPAQRDGERRPEPGRDHDSASTDPTGVNGNNVTVDSETIALIDTGLQYQLATQEMNNKFSILHDSMRQDL